MLKQLLNENFIVLDTETTGLSDDDEIVEISLVDQSGKVLLNELIRPVGDVSDEAYSVHGISTEKAKADGKRWKDVFQRVSKILSSQHLVIFNTKFDMRLIRQTCIKQLGLCCGLNEYGDFERSVKLHCAMKAYAEYWGVKDQNHHSKCQSLINACKQQGVPLRNAHKASEDCLMTLNLIQFVWRKEGWSFFRTHKGLMYGLVPIYLDLSLGESPGVEARNKLCDWMLSAADTFFGLCVSIMELMNPDYEPMFFFRVTEELFPLDSD